MATALSTGDGIFMDGGGDFRAGGASSNFVKFDASEGVLTVSGRINIVGGGGVADTLAEVSNSYGIGTGSLSASIGTKINPYETQVDLSSGGMSLKKADGTLLADYGESVELRADGSTSNRVNLDTNGLAIIKGGVTQSFFGGNLGVIVGKNAVPIVPAVILVAFKLVTFIVDASKVPLITAASNSALPSELIDQPCEPLEKL